MAINVRTIDEETNALVDSYDASITPKTVWRNNNNKLYLIIKSIASGFTALRDIVLTLKYRFDPRFSSDDDLESAMYVVGEVRIGPKPSILRMLCTNTEDTPQDLASGVYQYVNIQGEVFTSTVQDTTIAGNDYVMLIFTSTRYGTWEVEGDDNAQVDRQDGVPVSPVFEFEALNNFNSLGRPEESDFDVRQRLLTDTKRQDTLRELELAINALPTIFRCNLMFNESIDSYATLEDGTVLSPKELLVVVTGVPDNTLAETVMARTIYQTHQNSMTNVVWYKNDLLVGGQVPVFYMEHKRKQFYLTISYRLDPLINAASLVEQAYQRALRHWRFTTDYVREVTEPLIYRELEALTIDGTILHKVFIQIMDGTNLMSVASVDIPRLMLPQLMDIFFVVEEV